MDIERILLWACFFFTIALVSIGVLLIFRKDRSAEHSSYKFLQYFVILSYTYGFYSYWGSIILGLLPFEQNLDKFIQVVQIMGIPFLFSSIAMQYIWIREALMSKVRIGWYVTAMAAILLIGYFIYIYPLGKDLVDVVSYRVIAAIVILVNGMLLITKPSSIFQNEKRLIIGIMILTSAVAHIIFTFLNLPFINLTDTFVFFLLNTTIAALFMYWCKPPVADQSNEASFQSFFMKHDITQRESEIILEIYQGKTNQQIADSLFISLQTVKDHTHRIYRKTFVKNRSQLSSKLRELTSL